MVARAAVERIVVQGIENGALSITAALKKRDFKWGCLTSGPIRQRRAFVLQYCLTFSLLSVKHNKSRVVIQDSQT